jgi:hypothetical protein
MIKNFSQNSVSQITRTILAGFLFLAFTLYSTATPAYAKKNSKNPVPIPSLSQTYNIHVNQDGMYRITYEALKSSGLDLLGIRPTDFAVTLRGQAVPIFVSNDKIFGPGEYIDFYGVANHTLYTDTNIYQVQVNRNLAARISAAKAKPKSDQFQSYYLENLVNAENKRYYVASPTGDPWFHSHMLVDTKPLTWDYTIQLDNYVPGAAPVSFLAEVFGGTSFSVNPDHHIQVLINSQLVADKTFDSTEFVAIEATDLPVVPGENYLSFYLPADTGASFDEINLESYTITYPRAFVAQQGKLQFTAAGENYKVTGFDNPDIVVYRITDGTPEQLTGITAQPENDGYSIAFAGTTSPATYWVSTASNLLRAPITTGRTPVDITSGVADYIIISHPDFIDGLTPLVEKRSSQGYSVKVVDVEDIYAQFSYGIFGPQAIRDYITHAYYNMETRYVLLVGSDSYDYKNYLGLGSQSFIPTFYATTDQYSRFAPADPLFSDVTGDNIPDLALGRFPVRDNAQLNAVISKTLAYEQNDFQYKSVFSSDKYFSRYSNTWATLLPEEWTTDYANLDQMTTASAREVLFEKIKTGATLVNYFGHSSPTVWTYSGLLNVKDIPNFQNIGKPFVVAQYGCWNTYFVNPRQISLGELFLLAENKGAAAVLGSTSNNYLHSQYYLGQYLTPKLTSPGTTIGQALLSAKQEMAAAMPAFLEVELGWTILGDPTLVMVP